MPMTIINYKWMLYHGLKSINILHVCISKIREFKKQHLNIEVIMHKTNLEILKYWHISMANTSKYVQNIVLNSIFCKINR